MFLVLKSLVVDSKVAEIADVLGINFEEEVVCNEKNLRNILLDKVVRIVGKYSEGTGFAISDSEIITNYHVIDGEDSPKVVFINNDVVSPIFIRGNKTEDVAILLLDRKLTPLEASYTNFSDFFGENVYAAGYPLGSSIAGDMTIVKGNYTGERKVGSHNVSYLESSIGVEHGMSGGPLVDSCGKILGMTTAGINGTSYFLNFDNIQDINHLITEADIEKVDLDLETPEGIVKAYYFYIRSRTLGKAYDLLSEGRRSTISFEDYKNGYNQTLQVDLTLSKIDPKNPKQIHFKLTSEDWVNGEIEQKYFEGYWIVDENLKLADSNIKEIENPDWQWFYNW